MYKEISANIEKFYERGIVHSDLSEFNILYWKGKVFIIDFPQSIDIRSNPNTEAFLRRDKESIKQWYESRIKFYNKDSNRSSKL